MSKTKSWGSLISSSYARRLRVEDLEARRMLAAVSINFGANEQVVNPTDVAGFVPQSNWNNASGEISSLSNLIDDSNATTTLDVSWSANNTFRITADAAADANARLYKGYLDTSAVSTTTVSVSEIPYAIYDVYVYFDGDAATDRTGSYEIDTNTLAPVTQGPYLDNANWPIATGGGSFTLAEAPDDAGNYAVFSFLTGESFDLTATPIGGGNPRAPINGIQIVERSLIVDSTADTVDPTDGLTTLREAINAANGNLGPDTITFDPTVFDGVGTKSLIRLSGTELEITDSLAIDGSTGVGVVISGDAAGNDTLVGGTFVTDVADSLANDATSLDDNSRVLNFSATSGDLTLQDLTITGGRTTGRFGYGGGIRFSSDGILTLTSSTVSGNSTTGDFAYGGGIYTSFGSVTLASSTVSGNTSGRDGGGIRTSSGSVTLNSSTVSGNTSGRDGGGIRTFTGSVTITSSTVSGNISGYDGGGIYTFTGSVTLTSSTVSGNTSGDDGGGITTFSGSVTLTRSTITDNHAGGGGGLFAFNSFYNPSLTIENSILAGNTDSGGTPNDLVPDPDSLLTINHSLIGVADSGLTQDQQDDINNGAGNQTGTAAMPLDPLLGPLTDNGGPTFTRALLPGSPAIDAGDMNFVGPPAYDQRGFSFDRVVGGRIDIGALESGATSPDFDADGDVDGADFLQWQRGVGVPSPSHSEGDANLDGTVDGGDLSLWSSAYGDVAMPLVAELSAISSQPEALARSELIDAAMAWELRNLPGDDQAEAVDEQKPLEATTPTLSPNVRFFAPPPSRTAYRDAEATSKPEDTDEPWLSDELLERVFG